MAVERPELVVTLSDDQQTVGIRGFHERFLSRIRCHLS